MTVAEQVRTLLGTPSATRRWRWTPTCGRRVATGRWCGRLASYEAYYEQWAQPWEIQALLRAHRGRRRRGSGAAVPVDGRQDAISAGWCVGGGGAGDPADQGAGGRRAATAWRGPNTHTKLGRGGLADVEWTVQLLQLRNAHNVPALHNTSTLEALDAIGAAELIAEGDVDLLREAWLTATRARNALVLVRGKATDQLPDPGGSSTRWPWPRVGQHLTAAIPG